MPRATLKDVREKHDLTSLPGAYVELRKFSYGERLHRRDIGMKVRPGQGRNDVNVEMDSVKSTVFDFSRAITDHNLEDENGDKLDLTKEAVILTLDPDVAEEIDGLISDLNGLNAETFQPGVPTSDEEIHPVRSDAGE